MTLGFVGLDHPDAKCAKEAARGTEKAFVSSSARSAPMCSLLDPCSDFDVAMVPAAMARQDRHKRRRRLGRVPVDKTIDFWTLCTVWSTLVVDIFYDTSIGEPFSSGES